MLRSRQSRRRLALAMTLSLAWLATACVPVTTRAVVTDTSCMVFRPITWSGRDTDETIRQVRSHNAAFDAACPPRPLPRPDR